MIIEGDDYKLTPIDDSTPRFDLELLYTIKSRSKESKQEFKISAYGVELEYAIKKIAQFRVNNKHENEAIDLKTYFTEFKDEVNSLLCKLSTLKN